MSKSSAVDEELRQSSAAAIEDTKQEFPLSISDSGAKSQESCGKSGELGGDDKPRILAVSNSSTEMEANNESGHGSKDEEGDRTYLQGGNVSEHEAPSKKSEEENQTTNADESPGSSVKSGELGRDDLANILEKGKEQRASHSVRAVDEELRQSSTAAIEDTKQEFPLSISGAKSQESSVESDKLGRDDKPRFQAVSDSSTDMEANKESRHGSKDEEGDRAYLQGGNVGSEEELQTSNLNIPETNVSSGEGDPHSSEIQEEWTTSVPETNVSSGEGDPHSSEIQEEWTTSVPETLKEELVTLYLLNAFFRWEKLGEGQMTIEAEGEPSVTVVNDTGLILLSGRLKSNIHYKLDNAADFQIGWLDYEHNTYYKVKFVDEASCNDTWECIKGILGNKFLPLDGKAVMYVNEDASRAYAYEFTRPTPPWYKLFGKQFVSGVFWGCAFQIMVLRVGREDAKLTADILIAFTVVVVWVLGLWECSWCLSRRKPGLQQEWRPMMGFVFVLVCLLICLAGLMISGYHVYKAFKGVEVMAGHHVSLCGTGTVMWFVFAGLAKELFFQLKANFHDLLHPPPVRRRHTTDVV